MVKYEDILKQIEGADYIPLEQRTKVQNVIPKAQVQETNKSVLDTAKLIGSNIVSGANSVFEGIADLGASALIPAAKLTSKLVDNKVGKFIFGEDAADYHNNPLYQIAQPMIEENISQDITQSAANKYDKTSYVKSDSTVAKVSQGLGQAVGLVIGGKFFDFNAKLPGGPQSHRCAQNQQHHRANPHGKEDGKNAHHCRDGGRTAWGGYCHGVRPYGHAMRDFHGQDRRGKAAHQCGENENAWGEGSSRHHWQYDT